MGKQCIIKERFEKKYRVPELDKKLTKNRILSEVRNIARSSKVGINVPTVYFVNMIKRKIYMQAIPNSVQLKIILNFIDEHSLHNPDDHQYDSFVNKICNVLGETLSKLHGNEIIHGDLTPSNILLSIRLKDQVDNFDLNYGKTAILKQRDFDSLYLIDFGLSSFTNSIKSSIEDKAVDLYVLKRAIVSNNPKSEELFEKIIKVYEKKIQFGDKIIEHYKKVEMRGRKRVAFG